MMPLWQPATWSQAWKKRPLLFAGLVIAFVMGAIGVGAAWPQPSLVRVEGLGQTISFQTKEKQLGAALGANGIHLADKDQVSPTLSTALHSGKEVTVVIQKAFPVTVTVDGKDLQVNTVVKSVGDVLQELAVSLGQKDSVSVALDQPVAPDMAIKIVRRMEKSIVVTEAIPFETVKHEDESMTIGETKEVQVGEPGVKKITRTVLLEDGQEVKSEVVDEQVVKVPLNRVVAYGTTGSLSRGGRDFRYSKVMDVSSTGYTAGLESNPQGTGHTYTGMKAVRGVIAVDPRVIPLYTRVYVEDYGPAVAADIGGAIKGNKIDLCFDSLSEALAWGVRPVKVYILGD